MSDIPPLGEYLQVKLAIERQSLAYVGKSASKSVLFAVAIPYSLLRAWHNLVVLKKPPNFPVKRLQVCLTYCICGVV